MFLFDLPTLDFVECLKKVTKPININYQVNFRITSAVRNEFYLNIQHIQYLKILYLEENI